MNVALHLHGVALAKLVQFLRWNTFPVFERDLPGFRSDSFELVTGAIDDFGKQPARRETVTDRTDVSSQMRAQGSDLADTAEAGLARRVQFQKRGPHLVDPVIRTQGQVGIPQA